MNLTLSARLPFSFLSVVNSHGWVQLSPFRFDKETETLSYIFRLESGRVVELRLRSAAGGVRVEVAGALSAAERGEVKRAVAWMLGLDMDFSEFYALARDELKLAQAEKKAQGRVLRSPTFFEDVVKTILTTNTLWGATKRMTANLVTQFGEPLPTLMNRSPDAEHTEAKGADEGRRAFPTPQRLAGTTEAVLRAETRLGYRAPYVHQLAIRAASGELDLETFKHSDLQTLELRKQLMKIKGIGAYASANLLMLLGRYDFLTIDTWAFKIVSHEWYGGQPIGPAEVEARFEKWGKWKGLAYWFWDWSYKG
jgi:3-methyladenine DNA glycosylase/8-oxoguanine DNA glycosylase